MNKAAHQKENCMVFTLFDLINSIVTRRILTKEILVILTPLYDLLENSSIWYQYVPNMGVQAEVKKAALARWYTLC